MHNLICPAGWKNLLVCTDGSPESQGALQGGLELAQACRSRLSILQVLEVNPEFEAYAPDLVGRAEREIHDLLKDIKGKAAALEIPLKVLVRRSMSAYAAILQEVAELKPDLILMGRHGRTGLARLMLGSVAARVIGHSPAPVLVVPDGEARLAFQRLLVASDGSPYSDKAWGEALSMARLAGSSLLVVAVARDDRELPEATDLLQRFKAEADLKRISLETRLLRGAPEAAIIQAAREQPTDLILMGSHGRTGLTRLLLGSVAERVIGQAPCPVLVVK